MKRSHPLGHPLAEHGADADAPEMPGERSFGLVVGSALALLAGLASWRSGPTATALALAGAAALLVLFALLRPAVLGPLNRIWFRVGLLLHRIVSPVVMLAIFVLAVVPTGFLRRRLARPAITRHGEPAATSYWIAREVGEQAAETMRRQF